MAKKPSHGQRPRLQASLAIVHSWETDWGQDVALLIGGAALSHAHLADQHFLKVLSVAPALYPEVERFVCHVVGNCVQPAALGQDLEVS